MTRIRKETRGELQIKEGLKQFEEQEKKRKQRISKQNQKEEIDFDYNSRLMSQSEREKERGGFIPLKRTKEEQLTMDALKQLQQQRITKQQPTTTTQQQNLQQEIEKEIEILEHQNQEANQKAIQAQSDRRAKIQQQLQQREQRIQQRIQENQQQQERQKRELEERIKQARQRRMEIIKERRRKVVEHREQFNQLARNPVRYNRESLRDTRFKPNRTTDLYNNLLNYIKQNNLDSKRLVHENPCERQLECNPSKNKGNPRCICCYICNRKLPTQQNINFIDLGYECEHIIPYFSGAAFLGHDNKNEFSFAHIRCNIIKSKPPGIQNEFTDLWGWDILKRPYRDSFGNIHTWDIDYSNVNKLREAVDKQRKSIANYVYMSDSCEQQNFGKEVFDKLKETLNRGSEQTILDNYCKGLYFLAVLHSFNPNNPDKSSEPEENPYYKICMEYANNNHLLGNNFGNVKERSAFLKLIKVPVQFQRKFGKKNAPYITGSLVKYTKSISKFNEEEYNTPPPSPRKSGTISPRSPLQRRISLSSSDSSDYSDYSFGRRSLRSLQKDLQIILKIKIK